MENVQRLSEVFGEPISVYTRSQAIEDGVLVDVSQADAMKGSGIALPVSVTRSVWAWVNPEKMPRCQDFNGRLHDVLWMLRLKIRGASEGIDRLAFRAMFQGGPGLRGRQKRIVDLVAVCGPADDGSPCLTIMLPGEE